MNKRKTCIKDKLEEKAKGDYVTWTWKEEDGYCDCDDCMVGRVANEYVKINENHFDKVDTVGGAYKKIFHSSDGSIQVSEELERHPYRRYYRLYGSDEIIAYDEHDGVVCYTMAHYVRRRCQVVCKLSGYIQF